MPKPSGGRKRKNEKSNKGTKKPTKRSRRLEVQKDQEDKEAASSITEVCEEKEKEVCGDGGSSVKDIDIDEELDRNAAKSKLSVFNVKSIIHHVLSDDRVLAMACKTAEKDKGEDEDEDNTIMQPDAILAKEPTLTRSRFREVAQSTGAVNPLVLVKEAIIHSPLKKVVSPLKSKQKPADENEVQKQQQDGSEGEFNKIPLADINFSEEAGSSDEEYVPLKEDKEGSEDDSESCVSNTSDLASPEPLRRTLRAKRRILEDGESSPRPVEPKKREGSANTSQANTIVSPFKVPLPISKQAREEKEREQASLIASRTRSRLPLTDTSLESLEANFVPPDLSPDVYDFINLDDLDNEEIDWQKWLFELTAEKETVVETEDPEDSEYNFMAEDEKEEQEEYRNDRAVNVSQKELSELFEEFLTEFGDEIAEIEGKSSQSTSTETEAENEGELGMTQQQRECLVRQLQQHTQLLVQMILLTREHPSLRSETVACQTFLAELMQESENASNAIMCKLLEHPDTPPSIYSHVALSEAARVVSLPYVPSTVTVHPRARLPLPRKHKLIERDEKGPPIPQGLSKVIMSSPVFVYTGLLPHFGFSPHLSKSRSAKFSQCEDNLLVLGIAEHGNDFYQIWKNFLPAKTVKQIKIRRKNLCSARAPDNVMKQFKRTGKVPYLPVVATFTALDRQRVILPAEQLLTTSPSWLKDLQATQDAEEKSKHNGGKKKVSRRRHKAADIVQQRTFPATRLTGSTEKVVKIKPKEVPQNFKVTNVVENPSESKTVDESDKPRKTRMDETVVEPFSVRSQHRSAETKSAVPENKQESEKSSVVTLAKKLPECTGNDEISTAKEAPSVNPDGESGAVNQVLEKENVDPTEEPRSDDVGEINDVTRSETPVDTKIRERAIAFAQFYLNSVKKCLQGDSATYESFLKALLTSKTEAWSPSKLYKEISVVLEKFPELVHDFVGFLEPHQAVEAGVFMTNNEICRARSFLKQVEDHFQKSPSHFQKIIKAFTSFNFKNSKPTELYDVIVPLLKGQQYLIDEFNSFFSHLKPRPSNSEDFEEVELGSGSDIEVDEFEEVVIPDVMPSRGSKRNPSIKNKYSARASALNTARTAGRKEPFGGVVSRRGHKTRKRDTSDKNVEGSVADKESVCNALDDGTAQKDTENEVGDRGLMEDIDGPVLPAEFSDRGYDSKTIDSDEEGLGYRSNVDDESKDGVDIGDEMSPEEEYLGSDASHDVSSPGSECDNADDFLDSNIDSPETIHGGHVTSTSDATSDLSNEACDLPSTESEPGGQGGSGGLGKRDEFTADDSSEIGDESFVDDETQSVGGNENDDDDADEGDGDEWDSNREGQNTGASGRGTTAAEEEQQGTKKDAADTERQERMEEDKYSGDRPVKMSAKNLELAEDGMSVIVWTREDDRKILQFYQNRGLCENLYEEIARELENKTATQVEGRLRVLIRLLAASKNAESSGEESGSEADDDDDDDSCDETVVDKK